MLEWIKMFTAVVAGVPFGIAITLAVIYYGDKWMRRNDK